MDWMEIRASRGQSIHPFCNKVKRDPLETECTDDRSSVALCNLVRHGNELPAHFQVSAWGKKPSICSHCCTLPIVARRSDRKRARSLLGGHDFV